MMRRLSVAGVLLVFSSVTWAADIPSVDLGTQEYDAVSCIDRETNRCINNQCLTSEARDCQQQCRESAKDVCAQKADE